MEIWRELLQIAIHAPSPHNVQPWRVRIIDESNAELFIDSARTLPKEDVTGSFIILTMGLFIEALDILARNHGFQVEHQLQRPPEWYAAAIIETTGSTLLPFAQLKLRSADRETLYGDDLFFRRRTSRLHYSEKAVPTKAAIGLAAIAEEFDQRFHLVTNSQHIERIIQCNTEALFEDLNSSDYHDEIVGWFRYGNRSSLAHLDGLDARCMNVFPANLWLAAKAPWLMLLPFARPMMSNVYRRQTGDVQTLGAISGKFWKPADAFESGRFLMRFWLETAKHGLYIHPFGNLVTNRNAAANVEKKLGITDIWLIFKIGESKEPPKSHRLPVELILV